MQAAGNFVRAVGVELTAGMQGAKNNLRGRQAGFVLAGRDAAAVVLDFDGIALVNSHADVIPVTRKHFVDSVIDDFPD